jgi:hypothetical protein
MLHGLHSYLATAWHAMLHGIAPVQKSFQIIQRLQDLRNIRIDCYGMCVCSRNRWAWFIASARWLQGRSKRGAVSQVTQKHIHAHIFCKAHEVVTRIAKACAQVWTEGAKRPQAGNHHAAEVINNALYLFGGLDAGVLGDCACASCIDASSFVRPFWSRDRHSCLAHNGCPIRKLMQNS